MHVSYPSICTCHSLVMIAVLFGGYLKQKLWGSPLSVGNWLGCLGWLLKYQNIWLSKSMRRGSKLFWRCLGVKSLSIKHEIAGRVSFILFSWGGIAGRICAALKPSSVFSQGSSGCLNKPKLFLLWLCTLFSIPTLPPCTIAELLDKLSLLQISCWDLLGGLV